MIPYIAIVFLVFMLLVFITGVMKFQRALLNLVIFVFCLLLPLPLINFVVGRSNELVGKMFGDKFVYWAMIQHESYSNKIDEAAEGGKNGDEGYENYLRTLYATNSEKNPNQGNQCVVLKWQCPKKMAALMLSNSDKSAT